MPASGAVSVKVSDGTVYVEVFDGAVVGGGAFEHRHQVEVQRAQLDTSKRLPLPVRSPHILNSYIPHSNPSVRFPTAPLHEGCLLIHVIVWIIRSYRYI